MISVIAGNKDEFDNWLKTWIDPTDWKKFEYISTKDQAKSYNYGFKELIKIGSWRRKKENIDIIDILYIKRS